MATPLLPTFEKRITDSVNDLITAQVTPWSFLTAGPPFQVKRFDGRKISSQGVTFEGTTQDVFWRGYIEPFLEDLVVRELAFAIESCRKHKVDAREVLPEVQGLLLSGCRKVFAQMADVDRRLRGKGYPDSVPLRSVQSEQDQMAAFIKTHVSASSNLWESSVREDHPPEVKEHWVNAWYRRNQGWAWAIGSLIAVTALITGLWLGLREKPQEKPPSATTNLPQAPAVEKKAETKNPSDRATIDPLKAAIDEFKRFDMDERDVDVGVEKTDDPTYMAIWHRKMRMLDSIEETAKKFHREGEVESYMALKNNIRVESNAAPLMGKQPSKIRPTTRPANQKPT